MMIVESRVHFGKNLFPRLPISRSIFNLSLLRSSGSVAYFVSTDDPVEDQTERQEFIKPKLLPSSPKLNATEGNLFFKSVATPECVRSILCQCQHDTSQSQVTKELVENILCPGFEPDAVDVFLEFICYPGGTLPEELLPQVKCPVFDSMRQQGSIRAY